jgi:hypothetical protein
MFAALFASRPLASAGQRLVEELRGRAVARLLDAELSSARRFPAGEWLSRVFGDAGALAGFADVAVKRLLGDGLVAVGAIAAMFWLDFRLALAVTAIVPLVGALLATIGRAIRRRAARSQRGIGATTALLAEQIQGLSTIKGYGAEEREKKRFARANAAFRREVVAAEAWSSPRRGGFPATGVGLIAAIDSGLGRSSPAAYAGAPAFCLYGCRRSSRCGGSRVHALQRTLARRLVFGRSTRADRGGGGRASASRPGRTRVRRVPVRGTEPLLENSFRRALRIGRAASRAGRERRRSRASFSGSEPSSGGSAWDRRGEVRLADPWRYVCVVEQEAFLPNAPRNVGTALLPPPVPPQSTPPRGWAPPPAASRRAGGTATSRKRRGTSGGERRVALARAVLGTPRSPCRRGDDARTRRQAPSTRPANGSADDGAAIAHRLSTVARFRG